MKAFGYVASGMAGAIIAALVVLHPQVTGRAVQFWRRFARAVGGRVVRAVCVQKRESANDEGSLTR